MSRNAELSRRLVEVECRNISGGGAPLFWERASGSEVFDADGRRFVDFSSGFGVASVGHANPRVAEAVARQSARLAHAMGDVHPSEEKVLLLEKLAAIFGREARSILSLGGSEAVESALKTARIATGRPGVVAFEGAYHGLGYGALAATHRRDFREPFRDQIGIEASFVPFPSAGEGEREATRSAFERLGTLLSTGRIGAVIVEPIQGRGGVRVPPEGFLRALADRAREAGALLILDEVMTGFCRTGWMLAHHAEGLEPDIVAVGKGMGGGFPISAAIGRAAVMDAWPASDGEAIHTSTFLGHPVGCRAALETIAIMEEEDLARRSRELGWYLKERFARYSPRGRGLFLGIGLGTAKRARAVASAALARGLIVMADGVDGETIVLAPPLTIPKESLDEGIAILEDALGRAG